MRFGVGIADSGVQIYAPQNPDETVKALQAGLSKVLNYPVGIGLISPELYGNLNPDVVVSIGPRKTVGFLVSGDEQIQAGARSATIKIRGISSYSVTA